MIAILGNILLSGSVQSQVSVSGVSGNVVTGQTLTASGSNMVNLNTAGWINSPSAASFEGSSDFVTDDYNSDGWIWNSAECGEDRNAEYVSDTKLVGSKAAYLLNDCCQCPATISCCGNRLLTYNLGSRSTAYMAGYFRYTGSGWPTSYLKFILVAGDASLIYFQPWEWSGNKITGYVLRDNGGGDVYSYFNVPYPIGFGEWHHFELFMKYTSPKRIDAWIDGQMIGTIYPNSPNSELVWDEIGFPNLNGFVAPDWIGMHMDMVAYSTSRIYPASNIEVSNSPVYGSGTIKWQEPVYLSDNSVQFKLDLTDLGSGPYYLWITNNRQERSAAYLLSGGPPDAVVPTVSITSPTSGTTYLTSSSTITIGGSAWDNVAVTQVTWANSAGGSGIASGTVSWTASNIVLQPGINNIVVTAFDAAGNTATDTLSVTYTPPSDTVSPSVSLTYPADGSTVSGTIAVSATAQDNIGVSGVQFHLDGFPLGPEDTSSPYSISWDTTSASNGIHTLSTTARDAAGNTNTSTATVTVNNQASPATILLQESFDNNSLSSRGWYDGSTISLAPGRSGNAFMCSFASGAQHCTGGDPKRHGITATDSLYISYYFKIGPGWASSGRPYHPHIVYVLSDMDGDYAGFYWTYNTLYIEENAHHAKIGVQDSKFINSAMGTPPLNLCSITEDRANAGCNGQCDSGAWDFTDCYFDGEDWLNGKGKSGSMILTDDTWHHIEAYFKMNTIAEGRGQNDGIMRLWVDGALQVDVSDMVYRTAAYPSLKWNQIGISPYIGDGSPIAQTLYMDDFLVATEPPGMEYHPADTDHDYCISQLELTAFINRWYVSSADVNLKELIEAIGLWKRGGC